MLTIHRTTSLGCIYRATAVGFSLCRKAVCSHLERLGGFALGEFLGFYAGCESIVFEVFAVDFIVCCKFYCLLWILSSPTSFVVGFNFVLNF